MRSIYFWAKNRIYHSTTYKELIELQEFNATNCLKNILVKDQRLLIESIYIWIKRRLICSLQESRYYSILADECQDISTQEDLSIFDRWLVNGKPEEQFLTVLHVHSREVGIAEALQFFLQQKQLDLRKLSDQGYDGDATFAGKISGVHQQIQTSSAHAIYIHCFCHRLQLTSIKAAA